jgi:catechol 2,3-dioxygenase-like lactoylglutathione lyase family enzyme
MAALVAFEATIDQPQAYCRYRLLFALSQWHSRTAKPAAKETAMTALSAAKSVAFVQVADRARGVSFYRDTLGMTHTSADEFGDAFEFGTGIMRLTAIPDWTAGAHPVIGWEVGDLEATVTALGDKGIAMMIYDGMGMDANGIWRAPDGHASLAWFADPDGNCLMLSQHA